jgi:hypothetical protein
MTTVLEHFKPDDAPSAAKMSSGLAIAPAV